MIRNTLRGVPLTLHTLAMICRPHGAMTVKRLGKVGVNTPILHQVSVWGLWRCWDL